MKKCAYILILIIAVALASCNGSVNSAAGNKANSDEFFTKNWRVVSLLDSSDSVSPKYEIDVTINFIESANKEREKKINNTILYSAFGLENLSPEVAIDSFVSESLTEYADLRHDYLNEKQINNNHDWFNITHHKKTYVEYGRKNLINYTIHDMIHNGASQPTDRYQILTFDPETGEEIHLQDVFKENSEEYLYNRLLDQLAEKVGANSRQELEEKGYLHFNDMFTTENFIMKEDSVLFYYNVYELAPREIGTIILGFTYEDLAIILK